MGSNLTHIVSGDLISFKSADTGHIESLKVNFLPVQEGSGDPSPSNVREISGWQGLKVYQNGRNLVKLTEYTGQFFNVGNEVDLKKTTDRISVSENNNVISLSAPDYPWYGCVCATDMLPAGNYTIHTELSDNNNIRRSAYSTDQNLITTNRWPLIQDNVTITLTESSRIVVTLSLQESGTTGTITNLQVEAGNNYTTYESYYGQIIPVTFPVLGKNKFNPNATYTQNTPSSLWANWKFTDDDEMYNISFTVKDNTIDLSDVSLLFTYNPKDIEQGYNYVMKSGVIQSDKTNTINGGIRRVIGKSRCQYITYTPPNDNTLSRILSKYDIQVELGSTATSYEPYNPYNTVYGGYIDLAKGELVAEWITETIDKNRLISFSPSEASANHATFETTYHFWKYRYNGNNSQFCNILKVLPNVSQWANQMSDNTIGFLDTTGDEYSKAFRMKIANITTKSDMEDWLDNNPVQICYKLYTPITCPLSKFQLQTLLGQNHIWSNANLTTEVTYQFQDHLSKQRISMRQPHLVTTTGAIASFDTDMRAKLSQCKIEFVPIQEGSGDPSPENIRAISGWIGLSLLQCNKNILDPSIRKDNNGFVQSFGGNSGGSTNGDLILPAGTYTFSTNGPVNTIAVYKKGGAFITIQQSTAATFTLNETTEIGIIYLNSDPSYNYQLEVGSIATEYVPYNAQIIPIDWTSTAGTVYGGYIDLINGKLVQTYTHINLGTIDWKYYNYFGHNGGYTTAYQNIIASYDTDTMPNAYCTNLQMCTDTEFNQTSNSGYDITINSLGMIKVTHASGTDATNLKEVLSNTILVCELKTPIEYQITPQTLKTLKGINNIWSNANDPVSITYWTH